MMVGFTGMEISDMTVAELITQLQALPQHLVVMVYEGDPDAYVPVSEVDYLDKVAEPHVRLITEWDKI